MKNYAPNSPRLKGSSTSSKTRAFTIVEVLIIISIIAILLGILLPALAKARQQERIRKGLELPTETVQTEISKEIPQPVIPVPPGFVQTSSKTFYSEDRWHYFYVITLKDMKNEKEYVAVLLHDPKQFFLFPRENNDQFFSITNQRLLEIAK